MYLIVEKKIGESALMMAMTERMGAHLQVGRVVDDGDDGDDAEDGDKEGGQQR